MKPFAQINKSLQTYLSRNYMTVSIALLAALPVAILVVVMGSYLVYQGYRDADNEVQEQGASLLALLEQNSQYGLMTGSVDALGRTAQAFASPLRGVVAVEIRDADSQRLAGMQTFGDSAQDLNGAGVTRLDREVYQIAPNNDVLLDGQLTVARPERVLLGFVSLWLRADEFRLAHTTRLWQALIVVILALVLTVAAGFWWARSFSAPLQAAVNQIRDISNGRPFTPYVRFAKGELAWLHKNIATMARQIEQNRDDLESEIASRTREVEEARRVAEVASNERRVLVRRLDLASEEQRRSLAEDLHDHIGALIVAARLRVIKIEAICERMNSSETTANAATDLTEVTGHLSDLSKQVDELYKRNRHLVQGLRPEIIEVLGLVASIEELVGDYQKIHSECRFVLQVSDKFAEVHGATAMTLFRIVQECLVNAMKHSRATRCDISMSRTPDGEMDLLVADNGVGIDTVRTGDISGIGLIAMKEKVDSLNGRIAVSGERGKGTRIAIVVPLQGEGA